MKKPKKIHFWFITGTAIFFILLLMSIILLIVNFFIEINYLFWIIIPSIIFEELFETCCYGFSNNILANFVFILIFWFVVGAVIGLLVDWFL
ncbi:hypothetical protein GF386_01160 [Candidatus Pacearchaeota archaeon]|nr:hypothetical protein [Candidatus Pacearchaeota archaeon]